MLLADGSAPTTEAPSRARGSDNRPPPQPISRMRKPARQSSRPASRPNCRQAGSRMKRSRIGLIRCSMRILPRGSQNSAASAENRATSAGSTLELVAKGSGISRSSAAADRKIKRGCDRIGASVCIRAFLRRCSPEAVCAPAISLLEAAMGRLVMKFGGTSVADIEHIRNVARHVKREVDAGHEVAVVVSAMAATTNRLVEWCREAAVLHDAREYDTVVASGEQVTSGLLAIALQGIGVAARSWQGWQIPIATTDAHGLARILEVNGAELVRRFKERGEVAVISGFQGVHGETGRITTLGRGGSDTSAVAVAAAIQADRCDIYTDVDGVYTSDPRVVPKARRLEKIAFEEMLELASLGAKVLQVRSVELGMVHNVRICVRSSFEQPDTAGPRGSPAGTLIWDEEEISIRRVQDKPGVAAAIFGPLAEANINVDMIVQNVSGDGATTDITFTVPAGDYARANAVLAGSRPAIGYERVDGANDVAKVSVIGIGMRSHAGVAAQAFRALAERGINIRAITTSEIKFSLLIDAAYTELAVRTLHSLYGLDG